MAVSEHKCQLFRTRKPAPAERWDRVGRPTGIKFDPDSVRSFRDALLEVMRWRGARESDVEQYRLSLLDENGSVSRSVRMTAAQFAEHKAGYLVDAPGAGRGAGGPLEGVSDEELIAELRRRLAGY